MITILVVGYSAWDVIFPLADTPLPDTKTEVAPIIACGGGPGATAAVALSRLGCAVRLLTVLSDDAEGRAHRRELLAEGVDLSLTRTVPDSTTPRAIIRVDPRSGARRIYWGRGDLPRLDPGSVDPGWLDGLDLLYCDSQEAPAAAILAGAARQRGLPVVLDAGSLREGVRQLVPRCSDVIGATGFACAITGADDQASALRLLKDSGPARVGTTLGADGVLGLDDSGLHAVPAFPVDAVDTTGAGDAFHAGYAWALAAGLGFGDCLRSGAAVAALKCRAYGGRAGLPDRQEIEAFLAERPDAPPPSAHPRG
jgi:sulfofructose kinase